MLTRSVDSRDAAVTGTNRESLRFVGVVLDGANLTGAFLHGADLTDTHQLRQAQLDAAHGDSTTRLPNRLQRPASWTAEEDSAAAGS